MKKIIVAGAGHGGLVAAIHLAKAGYEVTVFEKQKREDMGYDWLDAIGTTTFERAGLGVAPEGMLSDFYNMRYFAPNMETSIAGVDGNPHIKYIDRKELIGYLLQLAENAGVKLVFETGVKSVKADDNAVSGIELEDGTMIEGDLVIDAAGVDSPVRRTLPSVFGIQNEIPAEDRIYIHRVYLEKTESVITDPPYNVFFYHCGKPGMDWMVTEETFDDFLIGGFGNLTQEQIDEALADFKDHYSFIGNKIVRGGGGIHSIPLRKTLPLIVANGYAAIGDSACMTEPLSGSGMTLSMVAGNYLATTIKEANGKTDIATLWKYQYMYFKTLGNSYIMTDIARRILAAVDANDIDAFLIRNILTMKEIEGRTDYTPRDIIQKITGVLTMPHILPALANAGGKIARIKIVCDAMPRVFNRDAVMDWIVKYENL